MLVNDLLKELPIRVGVDPWYCGSDHIRIYLQDDNIQDMIRSKDPGLFDILDLISNHYDEIMTIALAETPEWWVWNEYPQEMAKQVFRIDKERERLERWMNSLRVITSSDLANNDLKQTAMEALDWASDMMGSGVEMLENESPNIGDTLKTILQVYECSKPKFYKCRKHLPDSIPGIYLLYNGDTLDYVGCSNNIKGRLNSNHLYFEYTNHTIGVIQVDNKGKRKTTEVAIIGALHPIKNHSWNYERA